MTMIHVSTETRHTPAQVLARAVSYFGAEGLGLEIKQQAADSLLFQGGGGYVQVRTSQAAETNNKTTVDIESREWEHHAEQFLDRV
jgi:hypothetical protein